MRLRTQIARCLIAVFFAIPLITPAETQAKPNPRYAAIVMNADTGDILYQDRANTRRYPASLTKMMTLYLTFEAIKKGKLTWNQRLPVSARAARQPQTNISLRKGEKISVKKAVTSLIVRSANDASVVLAEAIGKTEWNFALQMTRKARSLGMTSTQFRNAHGLHNSKQYTTARDMTKLGLALRRDFPEYYHLFKTEKFTHKGRTYHSHNKVTRYYKGADGIKTGYTNASGYNLITTARKGGHRLIGVVLGGRTSKSRDNHMIKILDRAFRKAGATNRFLTAFKNKVPTPSAKPNSNNIPEVSVAAITVTPKNQEKALKLASIEPGIPTPTTRPKTPTQKSATTVTRRTSGAPLPILKKAAKSLAHVKPVEETAAMDGWGIQVGIFKSPKEALYAAAAARSIADKVLHESEIEVVEYGEGDGTELFRARLAGLAEPDARTACRVLQQAKEACFVYKMNRVH